MKKFDSNNTVELSKAIASIVRRGVSLQKDTQYVAVQALRHTLDHNDWSYCRDLIEGISVAKGVKSAKLTQYFEAMLGAEYVANEETGKMSFVYDEGRSNSDIDIEMCEAVMWFDFKTESGDKSKTLSEIATACARMLLQSSKTGKVDSEEIIEINAFMARMVEIHEREEEEVEEEAVA